MTSDQLATIVVDFQGKSGITIIEFRAWISGFMAARGKQPLNMDQLDLILEMVLKVEPEKQLTLPQTPLIPTGPIPRPHDTWEPFNTPKTPFPAQPSWPVAPPPIWCDTTPVGTPINRSGTYEITNTGKTSNGS